MKKPFSAWIVWLMPVLLTFNPHPSIVFAQGSLNPPGPPAPTMKTLDQIEARTPISAAPLTISRPGSYYLTTNLTVSGGDAITIATNGVTLDLNGFTIRSTAASATGNGILLNSGLRNLTIANGFIQGGVTNNGSGSYNGSGFGVGISYSGVAPVNVLVSRVSVSGCLNYGMNLNNGDSTVVESCTVRTTGNHGIIASTIKNCSAMDCGSYGIYGDQVSDSRGQSLGSASGIYAITALNCYGRSQLGSGMEADLAQNCYGQSAGSGIGLYADTAQNCYGSSSSGDGLEAETAQNSSGVTSSATGLYAFNVAVGSYGQSTSGLRGLYAANASFCSGNRSGGRAIEATIATGCLAIAGTNFITYKYNMP